MKRNRVPVSCAPCRSRKLKCNREAPCQNCIVRNDISSCVYAKDQNRVGKKRRTVQRSPNDDSVMIDMIGAKGPTSEIAHDNGNDFYRGGTHWANVVQELSTIEPSLDAGNASVSSSAPTSAQNGGSIDHFPSRNRDILRDLPSKEALRELLDMFFDSTGPLQPSSHVVHRPTIVKLCERHWQDPSRSSISWIGVIFAISCVSSQTYVVKEKGARPTTRHIKPTQSLADVYKDRASQCIAITNSSRSNLESLTAMVFLSVARFTRQAAYEGDDTSLFDSVGGIVRTALRMGLHRDPSHFPDTSPFLGEMRRRIWAFVMQMDYLSSFYLGLPSIIRTVDSDTRDPLHVCDSDLDENMVELPVERPPSRDTTISYLIAKNRILTVVGRIMEHLHSLRPEATEEVLKLDRHLIQAHESVPAHLQMGIWENTTSDPAFIIVQKIRLDLIFHEAMCALHRRYLKSDPVFAVSRRRCITSSMTLLFHQEIIFKEMRPGGCLEHAKWYSIGPVSDTFGLAAAVLCLYLQYEQNHQQSVKPPRRVAADSLPSRRAVLARLETSRGIWSSLAPKFAIAKRVARILDVMLQKLCDFSSDASQEEKPSIQLGLETDLSDKSPSIPTIDPLPQLHPTDFLTPEADTLDFHFEDFDWNSWDSFLESAAGSFGDTFGVILSPEIDQLPQ